MLAAPPHYPLPPQALGHDGVPVAGRAGLPKPGPGRRGVDLPEAGGATLLGLDATNFLP
jgi:hypothetical protein